MMPKSNTAKGALPCGNPKRYTSTEVLQMQKHGHKSSQLSSTSTSEDQSESGHYMKTLVKRQIHTDVTLTEQFSQHRKFVESSSHAPSVTHLKGLHDVGEHVRLEEYDSTIEYLKSCGLTTKEIAFKLKEEISKETDKDGYGADPAIEEQKIAEIEKKLAEKEEALSKPDKFNGGLELSRHAIMLEKAVLERQNKETQLPNFLFREKSTTSYHPDDPINHIPDILSDIEPKPSRESRRDRRRKRKLDQKFLRQQKYLIDDSDPKAHQKFMESVGQCPESQTKDFTQTDTSVIEDDDSVRDLNERVDSKTVENNNSQSDDDNDDIVHRKADDDCDFDKDNADRDQISNIKKKKKNVNKSSDTFTTKDFSGAHVLVRDEDIQANRLSISEIRSIGKFQQYEQGNPSRTVFVKNLASSVTEMDLISLFGRYEQRHPDASASLVFRLLNGRMKGQAFVTFPDIAIARDAITDLNGYKLQEKPMILSFGKQQTQPS